MKKWNTYKLAVILILLIQNNAVAQTIELLKTTVLNRFPSASSLEFYQDKLYVIGDDARDMWILNSEHTIIDSVNLFDVNESRIAKEEKADLEASTIIHKTDGDYLVAFGSQSTKERNKLLLYDLKENKAKIKDFSVKKIELAEMNIEGAAALQQQLLLSTRANNSNKTNYLIVTSIDGDNIDQNAKLIPIRLPKSNAVVGVSGLAYVPGRDILLLTASTEHTDNAYTDGEIGDSFIGYVPNISTQLVEDEIVIKHLTNLKKFFSTNKPQKIESIVVEKTEANNDLIIHLAADNDNGKSTLFKMKLRIDLSKDNQ